MVSSSKRSRENRRDDERIRKKSIQEPELFVKANDDGLMHVELRAEGPAIEFQWKLEDSKWVIIPEGQLVNSRYLITDLVGKGGNGIVYGASDIKQSNERVALKFIAHVDSAEGNHEVNIWRHLHTGQDDSQAKSSNHVVGVLDAFSYDQFTVLVSPLFDHDMKDDNASTVRSDFGAFQDFVKQMISGLNFIHDREVAHLDIKPGNIVVKTESGHSTYALIDFGLAEELSSTYKARGTPQYCAPEVYFNVSPSRAMDMWSLGMTMYTIITQHRLINRPRKKDINYLRLVIIHQHVRHFGYPSADWLPHISRELFADFLQLAKQNYQNLTGNELPPSKWQDTIQTRLHAIGFSGEQMQATIAFIEACFKWNPNERITAKQAQNHKLLSLQVVPNQK